MTNGSGDTYEHLVGHVALGAHQGDEPVHQHEERLPDVRDRDGVPGRVGLDGGQLQAVDDGGDRTVDEALVERRVLHPVQVDAQRVDSRRGDVRARARAEVVVHVEEHDLRRTGGQGLDQKLRRGAAGTRK